MKKFVLGILVALLALTMAANAAVQFNEKIPVDLVVYNPCTDEDVALTGDIHLLAAVTEDSADGFHLKLHLNFADVSGEGLDSGNKYQLNGAANAELNLKAAEEGTLTANVRLISQGSDSNGKVHVLLHLTVNANGEPTAEIENIDLECK